MPVYNLEFLNKNSLINYPIREDANRTSINGDFELPNSLVVDFVLVIPENLSARILFIKRFSLLGTLISFEIDDDVGNIAAMIVVDVTTHRSFTGYDIVGIGQYLSARGRIVLGDLSETIAKPNGAFEFAIASSQFEITTLRPDIRGINGLILVNGGVESTPIYGDIQLVAGANFQITEPSAGVIRLNAISGEGLTTVDPCATAFTPPPPIRTINGVGPNGSGDFGIEGSACMEITAAGALLTLEDKCSAACCGCLELEWLTERLEILIQQNSDLNQFAVGLETYMQEFQANVLATTT